MERLNVHMQILFDTSNLQLYNRVREQHGLHTTPHDNAADKCLSNLTSNPILSLKQVRVLVRRCKLVMQHAGQSLVLWVRVDVIEMDKNPGRPSCDLVTSSLSLLVLTKISATALAVFFTKTNSPLCLSFLGTLHHSCPFGYLLRLSPIIVYFPMPLVQ